MAGLHRTADGTRTAKYLVQRRDGTIPAWPWFVMGAMDPAAPLALRAYADAAAQAGMDPKYVADIRDLADQFERYRAENGAADPDAPLHRTDNSDVVAKIEGLG